MGKGRAPMREPDDFGDLGFQRCLAELDRAGARARRILGVAEGDDLDTIRTAYRRQAKLCHPDRVQDDEAAHSQFLLVRAAYEFLMHGKPGPVLAAQETPSEAEPTGKYNVDSEWGHFLWWRDKFFEQ